MPFSACMARRRPSKVKGRVTTPMVSAPRPLATSATTGARAGAGAAALAGGDEDHVGALQGLLDLRAVLLGGQPADLGIAAGAQTPGQLAADVELEIGIAHEQRLGVGVGGDELDAPQPGLDHAVDGVDAAAADADHLDDGEIVVLRRNGHVIPYPRPKVETVPTGELVPTIRSAEYLVKHGRRPEDTILAPVQHRFGAFNRSPSETGARSTSMVDVLCREPWARMAATSCTWR